MTEILKILDTIGSDTKRSHKLSVIEQYKDNPQFKQVVNMALNPYVNFYIRKIPEYTTQLDENNGKHKTLDWALAELEKLSSRQLTGNAGILHLSSILSSLSARDAVIIERVIGKDLRCGMADGIVNAVIKDFIPTYPCLLARPYDEKNIKNIKFPAYSQLKADGLRANAHVEGSKVSLCGRSGRGIDLLGFMDISLANLAAQFPWPVVFDGEFVVVNEHEQVIDRKTGNGIINKAIKNTISEAEAKMIRFQMWDAIPMHEFKAGVSTEDYKTRFERLKSIVESDPENWHPYWIIPTKVVNNIEEAVADFEMYLNSGHEGTILKNFVALWEDSRSKHLVKMKAEKTADLEITGWNPGTGQFEGQVGSLICASSDGKVVVSISGFSIELRRWITDNIDDLIGKIVEVMYNERISSKSKDREAVDSLFLPRFNQWRDDKTVANSSDEIK
jgi:ATP-dependent DNA ligase